MTSVAKQDRERALKAVMFWCASQLRGIELEQHILEALEFGNAEAMRIQLKNWGLPDSLLEEPTGPEGTMTQDRDPKKRGKRKAKSVRGPAQELPPSKEAAPLFNEALDKLRYDLELLEYLQGDHGDSSSTRYTREYVQDGRFIQNTREDAPPWAPDIGGRTRFTVAGQAPGNGLTELIAAYLLVFGDPKPLIEKLHFAPDKLGWEKLRRVLYDDKKNSKPGLLSRAVHAARLIRGADHEGGASTGEFDVDEQITRWRILEMREAGHPDQEIIEMLSREGTSISMANLKWLAGVGLPDPTQ